MAGFDSIIVEIAAELLNARSKFPMWPHDPVHASAVVAEESGALTQACLHASYEKQKEADVRRKAIQTAAMAIRFLMNMDRYNFSPAQQFNEVTG